MTHNCKFCNKEYDNSRSKSGHEAHCKLNPNKLVKKEEICICRFCNEKSFGNKNSRARHETYCESNENRVKPTYTCRYCNKRTFSIHKYLQSHENKCKLKKNTKDEIYTCRFCNEKSFSGLRNIRRHEKYCKNNPNGERHGTFGTKSSEETKAKLKGKSLTEEQRQKLSNSLRGKKYTQERKDKMSIRRKRYLAENPDKHPWKKNSKFISWPCEKLKEKLREKDYKFIEEFSILNYSIDIAFPERKLGLEVNGNQHYDSQGVLKEYYQKRHEEIEKLGWKLIEIHYTLCYSQENFEQICLAIDNIQEEFDFNHSDYFDRKILKAQELERIKQEKIDAELQAIENTKKRFLEVYEQLGHERFTKIGWVEIVSKEMNETHTQVRRIMQRYFPEILEKCFTRKLRSN